MDCEAEATISFRKLKSLGDSAALCLVGSFGIALVTLACYRLNVNLATVSLLYLMVIVLVSVVNGYSASAIVSVIAVLCLNYFFVPPRFTLRVGDPFDMVALAAFLTTALVITRLMYANKRARASLDTAEKHIAERNRAQQALRRSEAYLEEAQKCSHTGSFGWAVSTGDIIWSDETFKIFAYDPTTKPTLALVVQRVHPEDVPEVQHLLETASGDGKDWDLKHRLLMPDGSVKHIHAVAHAVRDESGEIEFVGAVMDVTAATLAEERLQTSLEEKEALLKEVHHRVKNNLQLISSLLNLQASRIKDPAVAELFADSRNRVRSMALVHENLYRAGNFAKVPMAPHIQNLCGHLERAYGMLPQHVDLATEIADVQLDMDQAISCGLIINELVSNALKHAFPDGREGRVRVELKRVDQKRFTLAVEDNGIGLGSNLDSGNADSLGLQLVRDLTQQLQGVVVVDKSRGTNFTVTFSAD